MRSRTPPRHLLVVVALLLIMAAIRLHNLTLQEPFIDEGAHVQRARVVWSFDENPGRFANGKLLLYYWLGLFPLPPISALWIARATVALASLPTGATVYALGRMISGRAAGVVALALYALLPLGFFFERIALADPLAALFATLTVWRSLVFARRPRAREAVFIGLLAAAATLAKLTMGLVPVIPFAATLAYAALSGATWRERLRGWWRRYGRGLTLVVTIVAICWLPLLVPATFALIDGDPFTLVNGANMTDLDSAAPLEELRTIAPAVARYASPPLLLAAVLALGWLAWRGRRDPAIRVRAAMLLVWVLLLTILPPLASQNLRTRYFMPLAAPVSVVMGWAAVVLWAKRRRVVRIAVAAGAVIWIVGFALPFVVKTASAPGELALPPKDAAVYLGGNFAGDAFRQAVSLLETVDPPADWIVAERATCNMLYFFTTRPITCAANIAKPTDLLNAPVSYVVLNGHEPQPDRLRLAWDLIAEIERPTLRELAGVTRTVQVWRVRSAAEP